MPDHELKPGAMRHDPYKNLRFRIKWDGRYVAGCSKVGALTRTSPVVSHREGGDFSTPRKQPGGSEFAVFGESKIA